MPPLAYVDQHEQGGDLFFAPPYAAPFFHELPDAALAAERDVIGPAIARAFDRRAISHTSGDDFDLLYPGYGDSATTLLFGAVGMTFESGVASRTCGASPSSSPRPRALIAAVARHRAALLRRGCAPSPRPRARARAACCSTAGGARVYGYALGPGAEPLVARLMAEGVVVRPAGRRTAVATCGRMARAAPGAPATLPAGTYLVPAAQPLKHWIEAMLGRRRPRPKDRPRPT